MTARLVSEVPWEIGAGIQAPSRGKRRQLALPGDFRRAGLGSPWELLVKKADAVGLDGGR